MSTRSGRARARRHLPWVVGSVCVLGLFGCGAETFAPPAGFSAPPAGTVLDLAPGEFVILRGAAAVAPIDFPEADETQTYAVAIQNASTIAGAEIPLTTSVRRFDLASLSAAPGPAAGTRGAAVPRPQMTESVIERWYGSGEERFRVAVDRGLAGRRAVVGGARRSAPMVGQLLEFGSPIDLDGGVATCTSTDRVTGIVRAVGPGFAIVEDTLVVGHLNPADFAAFLDETVRFVAPVSEAYFGAPPDLDGNGVVIVLITQAVNRLGAAGFFTQSDFADAADCPTSNEGEILWLTAPDPVGRFGPSLDPQTVRNRTVGTIAHELQHLVHSGRRVFEGGGDLDSKDVPWLNEGLSHIAEEVTGLFAAGLRTGSNLEFDGLTEFEARAVFRKYHLGNFSAVRDYFESPGSVPAIVDQPVTNRDFRRARGFGYLFLRWLADQFASGGAPGLVASQDEESFFRSLAIGGLGLAQSTANVEQALSSALGVSRSWTDLFGDYATVPAVDDFTLPQVPLASVLRLKTWNLPVMYENASSNGFEASFPNGYPLVPPVVRPEELTTFGFTRDDLLLPSTAVYLRVESSHQIPLTRMTLVHQSGERLSAARALQVTIVRMF